MSDTIEIHIDKADGSNMVGRLRYIGRRHGYPKRLNFGFDAHTLDTNLLGAHNRIKMSDKTASCISKKLLHVCSN